MEFLLLAESGLLFLADLFDPPKTQEDSRPISQDNGWNYAELQELVGSLAMPAVIVDLDILDANIRRYCDIVDAHGKTIRLATKSVRVPDLIQRILDVGKGSIRGLMCYSVAEAKFLSLEYHHDDIMVAYPCSEIDLDDVWDMVVGHSKNIQLQVDCREHVDVIERYWKRRSETEGRESGELSPRFPQVKVCLDMDCAYEIGGLHLGANRSPLRDLEAIKSLVQHIMGSKHTKLAGVMGYEAQISGLQNANPFDPVYLQHGIRGLQRISRADVAARRRQVREYLTSVGVELEYFNGGGSGSLKETAREPDVTEVAAGSGFLQSHLFDYFTVNRNMCAFCYGLRVTRIPCEGMVTCHGGGFIGSGKSSGDKAPIPFLPIGLKISPDEGFGEVQTPFHVPDGLRIRVGDVVFARPAKAGEIAERFEQYHLKRGKQLVGTARTYRGLGKCIH